jgi:hypothetical protein
MILLTDWLGSIHLFWLDTKALIKHGTSYAESKRLRQRIPALLQEGLYAIFTETYAKDGQSKTLFEVNNG